MNLSALDEQYMREALQQADLASEKGEVPIGAVAVLDGCVVAKAYNIREANHNPLGHAEILLLQELSQQLQSWRLDQVTIYVTCEPCLMCAGAMLQARIPRVVYGCKDPKAGACGSLYDVTQDKRLNHQIELKAGVLERECAQKLSEFFRKLRRS